MQCPRCLNQDERFFSYGSKGWYCRKCIQFKRICIEEERKQKENELEKIEGEIQLKYPLTQEQEEISKQCVRYIDHTNILIHAVTGAGKTEMVLGVIQKMLREKKRCCFAIARRQVVLQIRDRLAEIFPFAKVIAICEGYTEDLIGDILVVTTHQLYRFYQEFDVLILDEPDAFPFKGNETLHGIAATSCKGHILYLTATPDDAIRQEVKSGICKEFHLLKRPHGKDLPIPKVITAPKVILWICLISWLLKKRKEGIQVILFVPTIRKMEMTYFLLHRLLKCSAICSKSEKKEEILNQFIKKETELCIATTILERGITIEGVDVAILDADDPVFDEAALIQMIGRVGRSIHHPFGEGLFLCGRKSQNVIRCVERLQVANSAK